MEYLSLMLGSLATNCYLLKLGDGKCVIVDIGEGAPVLLRRLETEKLTPCAILLTHGHFDHIAGVEQVREKFQIPVYLHALDVPMLSDRNANLAYWISDSPFQAVQAWQTVADGQTLTIAQKDFTLIHTPGHTPGSVCWKCEDLLLTGDTLFHMSRGRTDFPGGSDAQMLESFRNSRRWRGITVYCRDTTRNPRSPLKKNTIQPCEVFNTCQLKKQKHQNHFPSSFPDTP
ncbi:MBL fold metallo-hydrolase [Ruminococcus sp.]|uniref:MBL fold metallo-hydrolase n=1 Tax=Ruminococcus sp. TaxID=41978 RepID=UPI00300F3890